MWVAKCGPSANVSKGKLMVMINIRDSTGFHDVVLSHCASCFGRTELLFNGKLWLEIFGTFFMQLTKHGHGVAFSEAFLAIDTNKTGTLDISESRLLWVAHILSAVSFSLTSVARAR